MQGAVGPSDRLESLHLILGFLRDNGLHGTYSSLLQEAGVETNMELAPHVSMMRILLDWKRAFEARFNGTPRIIQPAQPPVKQEHMMQQPAMHPTPQMQHQQQQHQQQPQQQMIIMNQINGSSQYQPSGPVVQQMPSGGGADPNSVQTIHYVSEPNQQVFRQPVHIVSQPQPMQPQYVLTTPQGDVIETPNGMMRPNHVPSGMPSGMQNSMQPQMPAQEYVQIAPNLRLPGRLPGGPMASHSSSMHSPHEHDMQGQSLEWQGHMDAMEGTGHTNGPMWNNGMMGGAMMGGRGISGNGAQLNQVTRLKGHADPITQDVFLATINQAGPGAHAQSLFDFRRPQRGSGSSARRSAILNLSDDQHDAMYALAGCDDVNFLISNVNSEVRAAMTRVFNIDKESFTVWFKNRGRNPSKMQYGAPGAGRGGVKRSRGPSDFLPMVTYGGTPSPE